MIYGFMYRYFILYESFSQFESLPLDISVACPRRCTALHPSKASDRSAASTAASIVANIVSHPEQKKYRRVKIAAVEGTETKTPLRPLLEGEFL